jgi:hypothetical protein
MISKSLMSENDKLRLEDFVINQENKEDVILGQGSFATVYLAVHSKTGKKYAIKVVI